MVGFAPLSGETKDESSATISTKEIKELRRVYDELCYFADKLPKLERLKIIKSQLVNRQKSSESGGGGGGYRSHINQEEESSMVERLKSEKLAVKQDIKDIQSRAEQYIRPEDIGKAMKILGKRFSKKDIQDLMWEVDEKIDGVVDWEEFSLMFERNIKDASGLEPANLYNMVQFMIYDHDNNGMVSIDETMNMLYARLGRAKMETTITKLFGGEDGAPIKEVGHQGGEITFERYWNVVEKEQNKLFNASELGRNLAEKRTKRSAAKRNGKASG